MKANTFKLKKGGLDTIVAYVVVMLPLLYVLIYMVATIYHFSVQTYMNQVVKEATVMASTYGDIIKPHEDYIRGKLDKDTIGADKNGNTCNIKYYIRKFVPDDGTDNPLAGTVKPIDGPFYTLSDLHAKYEVDKADIIGIHVESAAQSILGSVTAFNIFSADSEDTGLRYTAYREEIIRNERLQ